MQASFEVPIKLPMNTLFTQAVNGKKLPVQKNDELVLVMHNLSN